MKILTHIKFAQTGGIAQVVLAFMEFVEKSKGKNLSIVAVNITDSKKTSVKKVNAKKTSTISVEIQVPAIAKVVGRAKNLADVEKEVFKHKIKKSAIIPNPVPEYFFEQEYKAENKNIGIVSRWTGVKNVRFCEKLAIYNNENGNRFVVNVITDLDKNNKRYKELAKLIKFHKPRSNEKLAIFYKNMGVVISPSHFETYGNVAKESIATGTPAMVSLNMGVSEAFKNLGLHDWIINFDSVEEVYGKIENVMGERVRGNVKDKMKELYAPCKIFKKMVSVLNSAT